MKRPAAADPAPTAAFLYALLAHRRRSERDLDAMPGDVVLTCKGYARRLRELNETAAAALARFRAEKDRLQKQGDDWETFVREMRVLPAASVWCVDALAERFPRDTCVCETPPADHAPDTSVARTSPPSASDDEPGVWGALRRATETAPALYARTVPAPGQLEAIAKQFKDAFTAVERLTARHIAEQEDVARRVRARVAATPAASSGCVVQ